MLRCSHRADVAWLFVLGRASPDNSRWERERSRKDVDLCSPTELSLSRCCLWVAKLSRSGGCQEAPRGRVSRQQCWSNEHGRSQANAFDLITERNGRSDSLDRWTRSPRLPLLRSQFHAHKQGFAPSASCPNGDEPCVPQVLSRLLRQRHHSKKGMVVSEILLIGLNC